MLSDAEVLPLVLGSSSRGVCPLELAVSAVYGVTRSEGFA